MFHPRLLPFSRQIRFIHTSSIYFKNTNTNLKNLIGVADPLSNLHPIKYVVLENETEAEKKLRICREELQNWNQEFWANHNTKFLESKRSFEYDLLKEKNGHDQTISSDEISVFYKSFLDENWQNHIQYLKLWYQKNIYVTFLHFTVLLQNILKGK